MVFDEERRPLKSVEVVVLGGPDGPDKCAHRDEACGGDEFGENYNLKE